VIVIMLIRRNVSCFLVVGNQHREIDLQREQGGRGADHDADRAADAARGEAGEHTCSRGLLFAEEHSGTPTLTAGIRLLTSMSIQIPDPHQFQGHRSIGCGTVAAV
jgi:hypothetical protein